jgi:transcriptional regulator with XRE-family HTH domain
MRKRVVDEYARIILETLSKKIVSLREEKGWSQDAFGERIKIGGRLISRYENRKTIPAASTIRRMAEVFGVTTDYLLFDDAKTRTIKDKELFELCSRVDLLNQRQRDFIKLVVEALISDDLDKALDKRFPIQEHQ